MKFNGSLCIYHMDITITSDIRKILRWAPTSKREKDRKKH